MIFLKTPEEIATLKRANQLVGKTLAEVGKAIKPGITTIELDKIAEDFIRSNGATPGFLGYGGFPNTLCISVNENVVHGIPSSYALKEGDIVSVDCGTIVDGFYGDSAFTFCVGDVDEKVKRLLKTTREALYLGIEQAVEGNRIGDIGHAIQRHCESHGYSVVRDLVGHGVGKDMHEAPEVPNFGKKGQGVMLKEGMVIAIEPMINMGNKAVVFEKDGWTVRTIDHKPSAHFEHTVAIHQGKAEILSSFDFVDEVLKNK